MKEFIEQALFIKIGIPGLNIAQALSLKDYWILA